MTHSTFADFGFADPLARALQQCGYETPTPIQIAALPPQLAGKDILGLAETGSGKTATFVLPILESIAQTKADPGYKQVHTLILAPTRELAVQIDAEVASLSRFMNIRRAVVLGGVSKGPQINALKRGVHVLVATPGRLLDHVNMRSCDLSGVHNLVLDEADRMFDMGFVRDIRKIVSLIPHKRRTAFFSATMPPEIRTLANELLIDPARIDLSTKQIVVDRIDQKVMIVPASQKQSRLHTLLAGEDWTRVIVFTRTKRGADRVAQRLEMASISAIAFHGNKAQNARQRALNDFTKGHVRVLVATDIAARGIDVSDVSHVVNFDMPIDPETYVHRVGRTARKGTSGVALSLCDPSERAEIVAIERLMKQKIEIIGDIGGEHLPMPPAKEFADPRARSDRRGGERSGGRSGDRGGSRTGERNGDRGARPFRNRNERDDRNVPTAAGASAAVSTAKTYPRANSNADSADKRTSKPWRPEDRPSPSADKPQRPFRDRTQASEQNDRNDRTVNTSKPRPHDGAKPYAPRNRNAAFGAADKPRRFTENRSPEHRGPENRNPDKRSVDKRVSENRSADTRNSDRGPRKPWQGSERPERSSTEHGERSWSQRPRPQQDARPSKSNDAPDGHRAAAAPAKPHHRSDTGRADAHRNNKGPAKNHGQGRGSPSGGYSNTAGRNPPKFLRQRAAQDGSNPQGS